MFDFEAMATEYKAGLERSGYDISLLDNQISGYSYPWGTGYEVAYHYNYSWVDDYFVTVKFEGKRMIVQLSEVEGGEVREHTFLHADYGHIEPAALCAIVAAAGEVLLFTAAHRGDMVTTPRVMPTKNGLIIDCMYQGSIGGYGEYGGLDYDPCVLDGYDMVALSHVVVSGKSIVVLTDGNYITVGNDTPFVVLGGGSDKKWLVEHDFRYKFVGDRDVCDTVKCQIENVVRKGTAVKWVPFKKGENGGKNELGYFAVSIDTEVGL